MFSTEATAVKARLRDLLLEKDKRDAQNQLPHMFPDETHEWRGQTYYARDLYQPHLEFFRAGAYAIERCAMAANRVGKTKGMGGYEATLHLTGLYPDWWEGRRWDRPVNVWAAGKTSETTRDIVQLALLGPIVGSGASKRANGTGLLPGRLLGKPTWAAGGVADCVDTIKVEHVSGGHSQLGFKAYGQGRSAFEGTSRDLIWFDEEPKLDVYNEALTRVIDCNGMVMLTFTPLEGYSEVVSSFLQED